MGSSCTMGPRYTMQSEGPDVSMLQACGQKGIMSVKITTLKE